MVLAVFAGLPGVGKSTLAERVAAQLPAAVLPVDTVDFTMQRYEVTESRPGRDSIAPSFRCTFTVITCATEPG